MRGSLCIYGPANLKSKSVPERNAVLLPCDTHNAFNAAAEKAGTEYVHLGVYSNHGDLREISGQKQHSVKAIHLVLRYVLSVGLVKCDKSRSRSKAFGFLHSILVFFIVVCDRVTTQ